MEPLLDIFAPPFSIESHSFSAPARPGCRSKDANLMALLQVEYLLETTNML